MSSSNGTEATGTSSIEPGSTSIPPVETSSSATSASQDTSSTDGDTESTSGDPTLTDGGADSSETSTQDVCTESQTCIPDPPDDWMGPILLLEGAPPIDQGCPTEAPTPVLSVFSDLQATPASCECECGSATGTTCAPIELEHYGTDTECSGAPTSEYAVPNSGTCISPLDYPTGHYWNAPNPGVTGGECAPSTNVSLPSVTWASQSQICGDLQTSRNSCGGSEQCIDYDNDGEGRICISRDGEHECPETGFSEQMTRFGSFSDTRNCTECTCGAPSGLCDGTVFLWSAPGCADNGAGFISVSLEIGGGCEGGNPIFDVESAHASLSGANDASCTPSSSPPTGTVTPTEPRTFCCIPE